VRISHRSSHLGDEFTVATDASRLEFGGEALDALVARSIGPVRVYGGGGWIFHSTTDAEPALLEIGRTDRFVAQLGADGAWLVADGAGALRAGIDWQAAERANWRGGFSAAVGLRYRVGDREAGFAARFHNGLSELGQFFWTPERYFGLEFNAIL
jgi:hypothetical protein